MAKHDGIKINGELLRYCIARAGKNTTQVSKELGMTYNSFKRKCTGENDFKISEVRILAQLVGLTDNEVLTIFYKGLTQ